MPASVFEFGRIGLPLAPKSNTASRYTIWRRVGFIRCGT